MSKIVKLRHQNKLFNSQQVLSYIDIEVFDYLILILSITKLFLNIIIIKIPESCGSVSYQFDRLYHRLPETGSFKRSYHSTQTTSYTFYIFWILRDLLRILLFISTQSASLHSVKIYISWYIQCIHDSILENNLFS